MRKTSNNGNQTYQNMASHSKKHALYFTTSWPSSFMMIVALNWKKIDFFYLELAIKRGFYWFATVNANLETL